MNGLNDEIEIINGYNRLNFNLESNTSIIIEPTALNCMDGKLILEPTLFSNSNFFSSIKRSIAGQSFISSQITNKTNDKLKISLSPVLLGTINKIEILPNQIWRFSPSSFIACTNNILVSGNLNIFSNFKAVISGQNILYIEISSVDGKPGIVWISSHGAIQKHEVKMGQNSEKLLINDGVFVGMLSEDKNKNINYWDNYVNIGSANGFFKGLLTNTALLMSIYDKKQVIKDDITCIVYTQSLNIRNLNNYIHSIAVNTVNPSNNNNNSDSIINIDNVIKKLWGGRDDNLIKLHKYENKLNNLK
jgi:uncharacterized protein (AIM24 family)